MLVAMATAWGRRYYGLDMAMADRYQAIAMLFWLAVGISALMWLQQRRHTGIAIAMTAALTGALMPFQLQAAQSAVHLSSAVRQGHLGASMGFTEMHVAVNTLSYPAMLNNHNYVEWHNAFLQQHDLAYFRNPALHFLGKPLKKNPLKNAACQLIITQHVSLKAASAQELSGLWTCPTAVHTLLLVDEYNTVVGLMEKPNTLWPIQTPWIGYAHMTSNTLTPVGITTDGEMLAGMALAMP